MGAETLSQAEVVSLLGTVEPTAGQAAGLARGGANASTRKERAVPYDFHLAQRIQPELLRLLESLHEAAARDFAIALSALARAAITVQVTGVKQTTYAQFLRSLENPTCFNLLKTEQLPARLALDISPAVIYPVLDRLLGGLHDNVQPPRRPLTEVERRLAARVSTLWLEAVGRAWERVMPVKFELVRVETDPRLAGVVPPSDLVVTIGFDLLLGDLRGPLTFCIPSLVADALHNRLRLSSDGQRSLTDSSQSPADTVELVVELASTKIPIKEFSELRVGDIITTGQDVLSPLVVCVDGAARFHARAGAYKGRRAICIEDRCEDGHAESLVEPPMANAQADR
ncbi:MAG TPA: FliM/FliN family flagellar motor switch protein [Pirellulales bacterium]